MGGASEAELSGTSIFRTAAALSELDDLRTASSELRDSTTPVIDS